MINGAARVRLASGCRAQAQLADLRELVGGKQDQRLLARASNLLAQRGLALLVSRDVLILADGEHERGDSAAEALAQVGGDHVGLLDRVVQNAGRYQVVRRADGVEQRGDLERVLDERGAIHPAPLPIVCAVRECDRRLRLWKPVDEARHTGLVVHDRRAYSVRKLRQNPARRSSLLLVEREEPPGPLSA